jgi:hypothetical protein
VNLAQLYLVHLNREYVRNGAIVWNDIFIKKDVTQDCLPLLQDNGKDIAEQIDQMHDVLRLSEAPDIRPTPITRNFVVGRRILVNFGANARLTSRPIG